MPRSGGASKTGEQSQKSAERAATPDDGGGSEDDSDQDDILETSDNGRYQKMNEQVERERERGRGGRERERAYHMQLVGAPSNQDSLLIKHYSYFSWTRSSHLLSVFCVHLP